jgi:NTP pyrophosphatase (non-canonical NTP hydrolase)
MAYLVIGKSNDRDYLFGSAEVFFDWDNAKLEVIKKNSEASGIEYEAVQINMRPIFDFADLQTEVKAWSEYNFPRNKDHFPLLGAQEELGELAHVRLKWEQGIREYDSDRYFIDSEDAIADIIIYLADYCARNGFNLQHSIETVWPQVKARDWKKFPKNGVSE